MINIGSRVVNNWLYPVKEGFVLIDTGYENGFKPFKRRLSKAGISLSSIRYIFLTHAHDDHAGFLNQFLEESPEVKVIMSGKAPEGLYKGQNSFRGGCTSRIALSFCHLMKLFGKGSHRFPPLKHHFIKRCFLVSDSNRKEIGTVLCGKIIDTPGHTADSISLLLADGSLFCGDAAMNGLPSIHKITIWAEDKKDFEKSWETIINEGAEIIYPGHGKPFDCGELKKNIPYIRKMTLYPLS